MAGEATATYAMALRAYKAQDWRGVLPLPPRSKMPPPTGFTGANGHWPSIADEYDFAEIAPPDANIGLRLPPGVIGLDVDDYDGKHGWDNLLDLKLSPLPPTWRSSARDIPSGIYLYHVPIEARLVGQAAPHVETIQNHHRFMVVWPSVHETGRQYLWYTPTGEVANRPPCEADLPDLPADWLAHLTDGTPDALLRPAPLVEAHYEPTWSPAVRAVLTDAENAVRHGLEGSRHDVTMRWCMKLCRLEAEGAAGSTAALSFLRNTFVDHVDRPAAVAIAEFARMVNGARSKVATTTTVALEVARAERAALSELAGDTEQAQDTYGHLFLNLFELYADSDTEADYLVAPLLAAGRGHALFAPAKAGKSLLMLEVAAAVASGRPCLDETEPREPRHVVYFDHEMSRDDVRERLQALGYEAADLAEHLHYALLPSLPPLDTDAGGRAVDDICAETGAVLAVFDTTARVVEGPENEADTFRAFFRHTGSRLKRRGVTYARLDHAGKDLDKGQRGSSAKADDVDVVWRLTAGDDDVVSLKATHRRMGWIPAEVSLRRLSDPLRHELVHESYPAGTRELADRLDVLGVPTELSRPNVQKWLKEHGQPGVKAQRLDHAVRFRRERGQDVTGAFVDREHVSGATFSADREQVSGASVKDAA